MYSPELQPAFDESRFFDEIDHPITFTGPGTKDDYQVYLLNRAYDGEPPIVIYNGLGSTPNTLLGQIYLKAYAQVIPRPIIAPMNIHLTRHTKRRDFADGHAWAIEKAVQQPVDIAGMSWGGVLGYSVAESLQDQANHLVTASSVGTINGLGRYGLAALKLLRREARQIKTAVNNDTHTTSFEDLKHVPFSLDQFDKFRRLRLIARQSFQALPDTLHPETSWHDIVGENDVFTSAETHYDTVARRNMRYPKSSAISVIFDHGHLWNHMRSKLAELTWESIQRNQFGDYTPLDHYLTRDDFSDIDKLDFTY